MSDDRLAYVEAQLAHARRHIRAQDAELVAVRAALAEAEKAFREIERIAEAATVDEPVWALPNRVKWAAGGARKAAARAVAAGVLNRDGDDG